MCNSCSLSRGSKFDEFSVLFLYNDHIFFEKQVNTQCVYSC